jgi:hypothetical protein
MHYICSEPVTAYYVRTKLYLFKFSLFPNTVLRPWNNHLSSPACIFTQNIPIFQHKAKTLPNFRIYEREALQIQYSLIIALILNPHHKGTQTSDCNNTGIHIVAVIF